MSEPAAEFKYWAFISYSHLDQASADQLHEALERYRVPRRLVGRPGRDGPVPRRIAPIFRDREELPTSSDLGNAIREALRASRYLIVVCSPSSASSIWVNEEVLTFKRLGGAGRILCLILDGEPNASEKSGTARECFCPALRFAVDAGGQLTTQRVEPLAADIRPEGDGKSHARLKLVAGLIGINFDDLKQREKLRQRWRRVQVATAAIALAVGVGASWKAISDYQQEAGRQQLLAATNEATKLSRENFFVDVTRIALANLPTKVAGSDQGLPHELIALLEVALDRNRFEALLKGHQQEADSLAFDTASGRLVTASLDGSVRIWDIKAGAAARTLSSGPRARHAIFSPSGDRVAVASEDGRIRIFDPNSGVLVRQLDGHEPGRIVRRLVFDSAGALLMSASDDGTGRIWDTRDGAVKFVLDGHRDRDGRPDRVMSVRYSPDKRIVMTLSGNSAVLWSVDDGRRLATILSDGPTFRAGDISRPGTRVALASNRQIALWDVSNPTAPRMIESLRHDGPVNALVFDPSGERLASASEDRSARLWDAASGRPIEKMPHTDSVRAVAFSPSGDRIATAGNDFTARVWNGRTGEPIPDLVLRGHTQFVFALAFSPSGDRLVTSAGINQIGDPAIRLWDIAPRPAATLAGHDEPVRRAAFSPDGTRIVSAGLDGRVHFWDANSLRLVPDMDFIRHESAVYSAAFDSAGARVVTASQDRTARIWDLATRRHVALPVQDSRVTFAAFDQSGRRVVMTAGTRAQVFDAATGQPLDIVLRHSKEVFSAVFSPSGDLILTAEHDERAVIWDARSGRQVRVLGGRPDGHRKSVNWASFNPAGDRVVTVSDDESARIWNAADGKPIGQPFMHEKDEWVLGAAFHPKRALLVTSTIKGRLYFWDLLSGRLLAIRHVHDGNYVFSVGFDPAGDRIVTASRDQSVGVYSARIDHQATIDRALAVAARIGLTR